MTRKKCTMPWCLIYENGKRKPGCFSDIPHIPPIMPKCGDYRNCEWHERCTSKNNGREENGTDSG